jgi:hypothetical protein
MASQRHHIEENMKRFSGLERRKVDEKMEYKACKYAIKYLEKI